MFRKSDLFTLPDALDFYLQQSPQEVVSLPGAEALTYQGLDEGSSRVAAGLACMGIGVADRVVYLGQECASYWEVLFACCKLGAVMVPVGDNIQGEDVDHIIEQVDARVIVRNSCHIISNVLGVEEVFVTEEAWAEWKLQFMPLMEHCFATPDTPLMEIFTPRHQGWPEGKVQTHEQWFGAWIAH